VRTIVPIAEMRDFSREARREGRRIGFVPTMGFLHEGHLSLVRRAKGLSDVVVVSIFVNPIQFGPGEDFERYPRDLPRDAEMCRSAGADVLFCPEAGEMYASDHSVYVEETALSGGLCGRCRPGHFRGVTTVVAKLFHIVQPDVALFGQKDAQQARVVERMVRDLNFPVAIVVEPTAREADGVAMSSRNAYLTASERARAAALNRALDAGERLFRGGVRDAARIRDCVRGEVERGALPDAVEYVDVVDEATLQPVSEIRGRALAAVAVRVGRTRLIDNRVLTP
jgi:pantoate--beta-alanine ligase